MTLTKFICAVAVSTILAGTALAADVPVAKWVKGSGKFDPAMTLSYVPFGSIDSAGKPQGFDVELAQDVADLLGVKLNIQTVPFTNQIPALASGRIKVAWTTFSVTAERLKQVDFVEYLAAGSIAATLPANAAKFSTNGSLCGANVAVEQGSSGDFVLDRLNKDCEAAGKPDIKKTLYPAQQQEIQAAVTDRVDAWLDDSTVVGYYQKQSNGQLVKTGPNYYPLPLAIAVAKGDTETAEMLRASLQTLIDNGKYGDLLKKYGLEESGVKTATVYTSAEQLPKQ